LSSKRNLSPINIKVYFNLEIKADIIGIREVISGWRVTLVERFENTISRKVGNGKMALLVLEG
jgi:hypothetical protein